MEDSTRRQQFSEWIPHRRTLEMSARYRDTDLCERLVYFTTGLVHVTLPNGTDEAWVQGGKYGLIVAADTADVSTHGHRTGYPGNEATIALQVPFSSAGFGHDVLHRGPCTYGEMEWL